MSQFSELISFIRKEINYSLKNYQFLILQLFIWPINMLLKEEEEVKAYFNSFSWKAYNTDPNSLMSISLAIELLHNFTLIHDDIMDKDTIRHSQKTIHHKWDTSTAILAGDGIYTIAQLVLNSIDRYDKEINKCFNEVTLDICEGRLDKEFENLDIVTEDLYLEMIKKKPDL